jgi:hypothetical protein
MHHRGDVAADALEFSGVGQDRQRPFDRFEFFLADQDTDSVSVLDVNAAAFVAHKGMKVFKQASCLVGGY